MCSDVAQVLCFDKFLNEKPWRYTGHFGTEFCAARCDLKGGLTIRGRKDTSEMQLVRDVGEAFAWHAAQIHPKLNGFSGYDCVSITIERY